MQPNTEEKKYEKRGLYLGVALVVIAALLGADVWVRLRPAKADAPAVGPKATEKDSAGPANRDRVKMDLVGQRNVGLKDEEATTRNVVETLQVTGSVGVNETRVGHIRPITQGRILSVAVRVGDVVRAGQTLAAYDNIELGETLGQYGVAMAEMQKAVAAAGASEKSRDRARNLVTMGAVAQAELERRNADYATAVAGINSQKAELARIEEKMHRFGLTDEEIKATVNASGGHGHREVSRSTLRAPFNGVVTKYDVAEGEVVGSDRELFTIADLSTVWVQADVYEKDIATVRKGLSVKVSVDSYPGEFFDGRITYVSDALDPKTRTAKVRCEVPNPNGKLKLDMFASIEIPTPKGRSAVMVPSTAIQQIEDRQLVFVRITETEFERRDVKLGSREGEFVEIMSGIRLGDRVVTKGSFDVKSTLLREQIGEKE